MSTAFVSNVVVKVLLLNKNMKKLFVTSLFFVLAIMCMPTCSVAAYSWQSNHVANVKRKTESSVLPVQIMKLVAYQQVGNGGVGKYLLRHGYRFKGRFIPEDLNPDFYYSKAYCHGCSVDKKGHPKGYTRNGSMVEIGSYGFGPCTSIYIFDKEKYMTLFRYLTRNGFVGTMSTNAEGSVRCKKTEIDFVRYAKGIWLITIWTDNF